jgi:hypothetical protein
MYDIHIGIGVAPGFFANKALPCPVLGAHFSIRSTWRYYTIVSPLL